MEKVKVCSSANALFSCSRGLPTLPPLPPTVDVPSDLYKIVVRHSEYPPIMKDMSWTRAAPYKETMYHRTPSESIANNYTPTANELKMKNLLKIQQSQTRPHTRATSQPSREIVHLTSRRPVTHQRSKSEGRRQTLKEEPKVIAPSRAITPAEQLEMMKKMDESNSGESFHDREPSKQDLKRYNFYITKGIRMDSLALCNPAIMRRILANKIPEKLKSDPELDALLNDLFKEVENDYIFSIRKAIVDYILMDPSEKVRLSISAIPKPFPRRTIRAPVPWHNSYQRGKDMVIKNVFTTNPVMMEIQNVWTNRFSQVRFVDGDELRASGLPVAPEEFQELVRKQCLRTREFLKKTWITECAKVLLDCKQHWTHLIPANEGDSASLIQKFFSCVGALMSIQLRSLVLNSLKDFLEFLRQYELRTKMRHHEL